MSLSEYAVMFVLVVVLGAGIPGPGDASLIAAGALAGEGKLNIWIVLATAMITWLLGGRVVEVARQPPSTTGRAGPA